MMSPGRSRTSGRRSPADAMSDRVVIRSYRRVFEVDRRIYRVDRWALPVPGGVPLRAVGYFAAALIVVIVAGALPGVGEVVSGVSAPPARPAAPSFGGSCLPPRPRPRRRSAARVAPPGGEPVPWHGELALRWD